MALIFVVENKTLYLEKKNFGVFREKTENFGVFREKTENFGVFREKKRKLSCVQRMCFVDTYVKCFS